MSVLKFIFICYMNLQLSLLASKETIRLKRRSQAGVKPQLSRSLTDKPAHLVNAVGSSHDIAISDIAIMAPWIHLTLPL